MINLDKKIKIIDNFFDKEDFDNLTNFEFGKVKKIKLKFITTLYLKMI